MKIDYAIVSTDQNEMYKDFWSIVKNLWINLIDITPILVEIGDYNEIIDDGECVIHKIKKIEGINTGLQSQIARMFITKYYKDDVCVTSDIDMLPLSKEYFTKSIESYDNDSLIIFSSDAYPNKNRYPICYNAAKGGLFNEILDLDVSFEEYCNRLIDYGWGWDTDELYFGKKVNEYSNKNRIIKLNRGWSNGIANDRIDRVNWNYDITRLKNQKYIDSHSLRPLTTYNNEVKQLIELL